MAGFPRPMYPRRDIDKAWERGETSAMDPELRDAFDRLAEDLRGEIRSGDAETRAYVDERMGRRADTSMWLASRFVRKFAASPSSWPWPPSGWTGGPTSKTGGPAGSKAGCWGSRRAC